MLWKLLISVSMNKNVTKSPHTNTAIFVNCDVNADKVQVCYAEIY